MKLTTITKFILAAALLGGSAFANVAPSPTPTPAVTPTPDIPTLEAQLKDAQKNLRALQLAIQALQIQRNKAQSDLDDTRVQLQITGQQLADATAPTPTPTPTPSATAK